MPFRAALREQPDPRVNDRIPDSFGEFLSPAAGQGARLLTPRRTPGGEIVTRLSRGGQPPIPRPLHVMAALGDARAAEILARERDPVPAAETTDSGKDLFTRLRSVGTEVLEGSTATVYNDALGAIGELFEEAPPEAPPFARAPAWRTSCTHSALAGWTLLRHAFVLEMAQVVTFYGRLPPPEPSGYVAPYPELFEKLARVSERILEVLVKHGVLPEPAADAREDLRVFSELMDDIAAISRKQLRGEALDAQERGLLGGYGDRIDDLIPDEERLPLAVHFATAVDFTSEQVGYTAVGKAFEIYVIREAPEERVIVRNELEATEREVTIPRAVQLYRGGLLSYYEPVLPASEGALTDSRWQTMLDEGSAPSPPAWSAEFLRSIRASAEARLRAGEALEDPELRGDPVALEEAAWEGYRKVGDAPDRATFEETGWGGYFMPRDAREERARRLLGIWLARAEGAEDCRRIIEAVKETSDTNRLVQLASRFSEIASEDDRRELFEAVSNGHPHLAVLAFYATDTDGPLDEVRGRLGESVLGRWALAWVLEQRAPYVRFDDWALVSLEDDSEDGLVAEDALFRAPEVIEGTVDPRDIAALTDLATEDPSFLVRAHAMHALASYPREHALPVLRRGLEDGSPAVRGLAALGLIEKRDVTSFPLISRVLFWLDDPRNRERARREGETFHRVTGLRPTGPLLWNSFGHRAGRLETTLFDRLGSEWTVSFSVARFTEEPELWLFGYQLHDHAPDLWRRLIVAIAGDPHRPPETRRAALDIYDYPERDPEIARALATLLDDAAVVGPGDLRVADLAAQAILQALGDVPPQKTAGSGTLEPPRDPVERAAALARARAAVARARAGLEALNDPEPPEGLAEAEGVEGF